MSHFIRVGSFVALVVALLIGGSHACGADVKPLSEKSLGALLDAQIDEAVIVARIQQGGVEFEANDTILERLRVAGASEQVLAAIRKAAQTKPAGGAAKAVTYQQVLNLLEAGLEEAAILKRLELSPTVFTLGADQITELKKAGATPRLLDAMQKGRAITPAAAEMITDFAIILDSSGSMREKTTDGVMKITAAKRVVTELVQKIPDGLNVTFVLYGHKVFGGPTDPRNCQVVEVVRPIGPLTAEGKSELATMIAGLQPTGATPIALSLRTAGAELAKNNAPCGLILITDGLETCQGDPIAEAAALVGKLKITFGVNVVGFGVKPEENQALKQIADAGKGKYYSADSSAELSEALQKMRQELEVVAQPAEAVVSTRRSVKVPPPTIEMPAMKEMVLIEAEGPIKDAVLFKKGGIMKYGEEIRIPSSTATYDIVWYPQDGEAIRVVKGFTLPERKVVEMRIEDLVGFIKVKGSGTVKSIHAGAMDDPGDLSFSTQRAQKYGDVMVVPVGSYRVFVDGNLIEEGLKVEAGKLYELE